MTSLHIAIASTTSKPGTVRENLDQIASFARRAGADGAQLLLTPEMSASGYGSYHDVLATAEAAGKGPIFEALSIAADETNVTLCAGFVEAQDDNRYLAQYVIRPDGSHIVQRKNCVTPREHPFQPAPVEASKNGFYPKPNIEIFEVCDVRCAVAICVDLEICGLNEFLMENGVQLLLAPSAAGGKREDRVTSEELQTAAGRETYLRVVETMFSPGDRIIHCLQFQRALVAVNLCGYDGREYYHAGNGYLVNPMGEVEAFFHGLPNLDRQRPMYAHAKVDLAEHLVTA